MNLKHQARPRAVERREYQNLLRTTSDRRLRLVVRFRRIFGWVGLVALILFLAANPSLLTRDTLRQIQALVTDSAAAEDGNIISYEAGGAAVVASFGDDLAVADNDTLSLQRSGGAQLTVPLGFGAPVLSTTGRYVLAYDRGGYGAVLTSSIATASTQTLESPILSGVVGETGDYALVTNESGYKSAVTVFSSGGKQRFKWATPDYYFQAAALSPDGRRLAVAAFRQEGTTFESTLFFRDLDSEAITSQASLSSSVPLAVAFLDENTAAVVGDYQTFIISRKGKVLHETSYAVDDLSAYAFGEGSLALVTRSYAGAARSGVVTIDAGGKKSPSAAVAEEVQAIDYDGARLALMTAGGLTMYDSTLRPLWKNADAAGARAVCLTTDGAAWMVYPKQATRVSSSSDTSEVLK